MPDLIPAEIIATKISRGFYVSINEKDLFGQYIKKYLTYLLSMLHL